MTDCFVNCDELDATNFDNEPPDPFPDDPNYEQFQQERAKTQQLARRVFGYPKIQARVPIRKPFSKKARRSSRRSGRGDRQKASRRPRLVTQAAHKSSSGVGNEAGEDPEPPPRSAKCQAQDGHKKLGSSSSIIRHRAKVNVLSDMPTATEIFSFERELLTPHIEKLMEKVFGNDHEE